MVVCDSGTNSILKEAVRILFYFLYYKTTLVSGNTSRICKNSYIEITNGIILILTHHLPVTWALPGLPMFLRNRVPEGLVPTLSPVLFQEVGPGS